MSEEDEKPTIGHYDSDTSDDDDVVEVSDPRLSISERKRQLESEMTPDERRELKGDWWKEIEDVGCDSCPRSPTPERKPRLQNDDGGGGTGAHTPLSSAAAKRKATADSTSARTAKRAATTTTAMSGFGTADIVRAERLRALGLSATSSGSTARTLGGSGKAQERTNALTSQKTLHDFGDSPSSSSSGHVKTVTLENGAQGWQCNMCTYINHADQGRCGEHSTGG